MDIEEKLKLMKVMFNPKSIAIFGGTDNIMKIGAFSILNIRGCGYTKEVYAINPNPKYEAKKIFGIEVYPSLDKCPKPVDLVGIVVPPNAVIDTVKQAIEYGVKTAAIITAGFGEVKSQTGQKRKKELLKLTEDAGMIFVGPNSMGFYTSEDKTSPLHLGFGIMTPRPGNVAIISQSGTIGTLLCSTVKHIKYFVSSGNEASLVLEDYLEYFARNEEVDVISLFVEGLRDGERFKRLTSEITKTKPIVFLKAGFTQSGTRAASSHTGSISGSRNIYRSLCKQKNIIYTENITEFIYLVKSALYLLPLSDHNPLRVGIISGGGGFAVHLTDLCEKYGLNVVNLQNQPDGQKLIDEISEHLPYFWSKNNPFDLVATRDFTLFPKLVKIIFKYDFFDLILTQTSATFKLFLNTFDPMDELGQRMKKLMASSMDGIVRDIKKQEINISLKYPDKKIVYISPIADLNDPTFEDYDKNEIMVFGGNPEMSIRVIRKLHEYQRNIRKI
ncbi:MAG: hypothetical protein EU551_03200 [Promethearchaeota archaeon]|nr:MAG: hypothetical protein EU551_03200 [Candidatus Lokiarchaeota archaeon]